MNEPETVVDEYKDVYVGETPIDQPVVDVRIRADSSDEEWPGEKPYKYVLEAAVVCGECKETNWILIGSDPGDYRCIRCTSWL